MTAYVFNLYRFSYMHISLHCFAFLYFIVFTSWMNITGVWMTHLIVVDWRWASDGLRALRSSVGRHCRHSDCLTSGALRGIAQSSLCLCVFRCSPLTNQAGGGRRREAEGAAAFVSSCRLRYRCLLSRPLGSCAKPFATKSGLRSRRPGLNGADPPESAVLTPGNVGRNYAWRVVEISCVYGSVREWGVGRGADSGRWFDGGGIFCCRRWWKEAEQSRER